MGIREQLNEDMKEAMRAKDSIRLETVRGVRGAITQAEVDGGKALEEGDVLEVIRKLRKQRVESIQQYKDGGREDLAERETREKEILESYLPAAPDAAAIEQAVTRIINELGASSMKDMGKVMQRAREQLPGVDGKDLSGVVRSKLNI